MGLKLPQTKLCKALAVKGCDIITRLDTSYQPLWINHMIRCFNPLIASWLSKQKLPHFLASFRSYFSSSATEDFEETVDLVGVPAEARHEEVEVNETGGFVLANISSIEGKGRDELG